MTQGSWGTGLYQTTIVQARSTSKYPTKIFLGLKLVIIKSRIWWWKLSNWRIFLLFNPSTPRPGLQPITGGQRFVFAWLGLVNIINFYQSHARIWRLICSPFLWLALRKPWYIIETNKLVYLGVYLTWMYQNFLMRGHFVSVNLKFHWLWFEVSVREKLWKMHRIQWESKGSSKKSIFF